jgi:hypothetical protein
MLLDNLVRAVVEAFRILGWLIRKLKELVEDVGVPAVVITYGFMTIGGLVVVSGWKQVRGTLIERWIKMDYEDGETKEYRRWYGIKSHLFVVIGLFLDILIVVFTIYFTMRLAGYELLIIS